MKNQQGTYYVIREHDGAYEKLPATYDAASGTITFATDKFRHMHWYLKPELHQVQQRREAEQQEMATAQQEAVLQEVIQQEIPPQETHHRPQP